MYLTLIINSIVCVLGTFAGGAFGLMSIVSIANMTVPWSGMLVVAALLIPVAFVVSGIGAWLAYNQGAAGIAIALIALPWVYGVGFVVAMLVSFKA